MGCPRSTLRDWSHSALALGDAPAALAAFIATEAGVHWLHRLVLAIHFVITLRAGGGVRLVSEVLELSGLSAFVGASYGSQQALNAALEQVHGELAAQGRLDDYAIFRRRVIEGEGYDSIAPGTGRTPQQCANATRLVTERLRDALRSVLREEGLAGGDIETAVGEVYEAFGIGKRAEPGE